MTKTIDRLEKFISLGRSNNNDIIIASPTISKTHAFFSRQGSEWVIEDSGSKNGTVVNDTKLAPKSSAPLPDGSKLQLGYEYYAFFFLPATLWRVCRQVGR